MQFDRSKLLLFVSIVLTSGGMSFHLFSVVREYLKFDHDEVMVSTGENPVFPDVTVCNTDSINGG